MGFQPRIIMIEQGKSIVGIALVKYLTDLVMRITPARIDRKRFAPLVSFLVAIAASIGEALVTNSMNIWSAIVRGIVVSMAASGAHSVGKNYRKLGRKLPDLAGR